MIAQNVTAAATSTGVSERAIREAVTKGELRASRVGGRIVIRPSDLDEWVQSQPVVGVRR
jgi:excisionase family DNA binding protein